MTFKNLFFYLILIASIFCGAYLPLYPTKWFILFLLVAYILIAFYIKKYKFYKEFKFLTALLVYFLSLTIALNVYYYYQNNIIDKQDPQIIQKIAASIQNRFNVIWKSFEKNNNLITSYYTNTNNISIKDKYQYMINYAEKDYYTNYNFVLFNKYFSPLLWNNKPFILLMPISSLSSLNNEIQLINFGSSTILLKKVILPDSNLLFFEQIIQYKAPLLNKYLTNYNPLSNNQDIELIPLSPTNNEAISNYRKNTVALFSPKGKKIAYLKYSYIPLTITIQKITASLSLINLIIIAFISLYGITKLTIKINSKCSFSKYSYFIIISVILWAYRFLWFLPDKNNVRQIIDLFDPTVFAIAGFLNLLKSPADFLLTSITLLTHFIIFIIFFYNFNKSMLPQLNLSFKKTTFLKLLLYLITILCSYLLYFIILKKFLFNSSKNLTNLFLPSLDLNNIILQVSISIIEIIVWLLSLIIISSAMINFKLFKTKKIIFTSLVSAALLIFYIICLKTNFINLFIPCLIIFAIISITGIIFINRYKFPTSKIIFLLISSLILTNYMTYIVRSNYYYKLKESFLKTNAILMLKQQEKWTYELFYSALKYIDMHIFDQETASSLLQQGSAYKIWTYTSFPIYGISSGIEFYDPNLILIDKFSFRTSIYPFTNIINNELNNQNSSNWQIFTKQISYETDKNKKILVAIKNITIKDIPVYIVVFAEIGYENLPFSHIKNPYEELLLSSMKIFTEEEQYWSNLYFSIYENKNIIYSNTSPPLPYFANLLNKDWQTIYFNKEKYRIFYFSDKNKIFCLSYPINKSYTTISAKLIELTLLNILIVIASILLLNISLLIKKNNNLLIPSFNSFTKKIFFYLLIIAIIPLLLLFFSIRNYIINEKISQSKFTALHQLQSSINLLKDYVNLTQDEYSSSTKSFINDEIVKWVSNTVNYDINIYKNFFLEATSIRELFSSGLLATILPGKAYFDINIKKIPYTIIDENIGNLKYQTLSAALKFPNQPDRIITIPILIPQESLNSELAKFYEKILLSLALIFSLSTALIFLITKRISEPIQSLILATQNISEGNFKISLPIFKDYEFNSIKESFEYMANNLDITLQNLKQRQKYIETIISNVTNGVIAISSDGKINLINNTAKNMLHITHNNIPNLFEYLKNKEELSSFHNAFNELKKNINIQQSQNIETTINNKNYYYKITWVPLTQLFSSNDILLIIEDLTDVITSNRLSAWADMARRVAHEIKNPLTPMQLAIEHLYKVHKDSPNNYPEILEICFNTITKQINLLKHTINQFSLFGADIPTNKQNINLKKFIYSIVDNYKTHLENKINFTLNIQEDLPNINWDINKMQKVFINILENAIQAITYKGTISINAFKLQSNLIIEIIDNGKGIPPSLLNKILQPYFTTKDQGTGLGLVIAKKFIEEHNGSIDIISELNRGTTVRIKFEMEEGWKDGMVE